MPSFHIEQFGCRATQADGAAIERQLREQGCTAAPGSDSADVVVLNTCTVTGSADAQARDAIRKIHAANPHTRIIVTGCYAQRAPEELASLPGVSHVVGNSHKSQIPALLQTISPVAEPTISRAAEFIEISHAPAYYSAPILTGNIFEVTDVLVAPVLGGEGNHTRPTLKIQDGCNSRCSFCVIPFVRGKSRSLPADIVIRENRKLTVPETFPSVSPSLEQATPVVTPNLPHQPPHAREIVLSGINLGTYGRDLAPRIAFGDLIRRILDETPIERLRIS